jgi:hypothetical protein
MCDITEFLVFALVNGNQLRTFLKYLKQNKKALSVLTTVFLFLTLLIRYNLAGLSLKIVNITVKYMA